MKNNQKGFSLIELLMVLVIIGVLASVAIPSLIKARAAAENGAAFSTMRMISTLQMHIYVQKNRYARLDEINQSQNDTLGTMSGNMLIRGRFTYEMVPPVPTDAELKEGFMVRATRQVSAGDSPYVLELTQDGVISSVPLP